MVAGTSVVEVQHRMVPSAARSGLDLLSSEKASLGLVVSVVVMAAVVVMRYGLDALL